MADGRATLFALRLAKSFFYLMVFDKCLEFLFTGESSRAAIESPLGALVPVFDYERKSSNTPLLLPFAPPLAFS